ncbi:N-6 DNA Methylase [Phycisphaerae bacterium RAS1]|nr:N-6 DNA Methylase [Phycisphaerae bacterium RAS1]
MQLTADIDLTTKDIAGLASLDAVAGFLARLGYPTDRRAELSATALGLPPDTADAIRKIELLAEDAERFFRVLFVQLRSVTAKARNELARNLGSRNADHLLILAKDFDVLEFVLIDKETRQRHAPGGGPSVRVIPRVVTVMRKASTHLDRRVLRRLTWTGKDGLDQFDKLRSVFEAAHYSGQYFQNRALFADHYLETRLREDAAWRDDPSTTFASVRDLLSNARGRWSGKPEQTVRGELFEPLWKLLGFKPKVAKAANKDHLTPDYELHGADGALLTVAFCYRWDRWLDGPDLNDPDTPEENPGAAVVSALAEGKARWIIVTNGKYWRLYSRDAHSRSTNFYEVDLEEALLASGETDPNEAFRYWWLFFRRPAFETLTSTGSTGETPIPPCWLDMIVRGSRDYAKRLGDRLKDRIFVEIFPHLAQGFLLDRKKRLGLTRAPSDDELRDTFEATLTLLYRLLFLLYAESRDLLPVREAAYKAASLKEIKEEIAGHAGVAESEAASKLRAYSDAEATIYDRMTRLFAVMDQGDVVLNVPCYNGGLFLTQPDRQSIEREHRIARFLLEHEVPDRHLALAIDRLARDVDDKTFSLSFIDYKSLEVRHLGSIYEGLLEFKLKIAEEDLGVTTEKKAEKYIPLSQARPGRGRRRLAGGDAHPTPFVRKGEVYLSNDKAERKATGSYYTPDPIVEYIVEHTVGPVLAEKLDALRPDLNAAGKTYHRHLTNAKNNPGLVPKDADPRAFAAAKTYAEHRDLVDRVFDLKVLDPAMGSGHFLVEAVDFITDRLLDFLNRFPHNPVQFALDKTRRSILDALGEQGVTVDPDKLTDVNLLKRHVLKRCIYGVDLNPMAVELAKVSLWLDAFTLGAPLSFLDHHLRCGNSLIGATFEDLKKATSGQLFAIDYEPLLRAIRHVLFVNEMADATAAEVHKSADEYSHARRELSGYQIVLDLLVADHFVDCGTGFQPVKGGAGVSPADPSRDREGANEKAKRRKRGTSPASFKPSDLLRQASDLDLTTRAKLLASLDEKAALLVEQVENVARRSDLRFFHWEIEFPEVSFGFADPDRRQIKHRNDITDGSAGFDAIVGNPPYDVLAEKELQLDLTGLLGYFDAQVIFAPAKRGKQNLYKLFICCGLHVARQGGNIGHIVPMPLLGDEQAVGLRRMLLSSASLRAVEAFPQKDDPSNRVFEEAKLSTCVFVAAKSGDRHPFRSRVHPGKDIVERSPSMVLDPADVGLYDPENQPLIACGQEDWDVAVRIVKSGRVRRLGDYCHAFQGEVNETTDWAKGHLTDEPRTGPLVLRGSNVCLYLLRDASQGEAMYLRQRTFLDSKRPDSKAWDHRHERVGFQRKSPQNNFRRLVASRVPVGEFCCDSISYVPAPDSKLPLNVVLALLNSRLLDWYFRLGSTNSSVNDYQFRMLPVPVFELSGPRDSKLPERVHRAIAAGDWQSARALTDPLLTNPPFGAAVMDCMDLLVQKIIDIESGRGKIARAERSALDPQAQPLQDVLDHMIYRMAGLTDADVEGLEERLARML